LQRHLYAGGISKRCGSKPYGKAAASESIVEQRLFVRCAFGFASYRGHAASNTGATSEHTKSIYIQNDPQPSDNNEVIRERADFLRHGDNGSPRLIWIHYAALP
jgi:hypothetical protein